ncbi:MAG: 50S ribosomal protein L11 methyltransferase [Pseudomonadota bacterium]
MAAAPHWRVSWRGPAARMRKIADALEELAHPAPDAVAASEAEAGAWTALAYYRGDAPDTEALHALLQTVMTEDAPAAPPDCERLPDEDWVRLSLEGLPPIRAGRFTVYGGHDRARIAPGGVALHIEAGQAFGTGHHETTRGCLLALEAALRRRPVRRGLDVGCGSGVLALGLAKATGREVIATDIDPLAVEVAAENARLNGAAGAAGPRLRAVTAAGLSHPAIRRGGPYDLIFANILARPLIALAPDIAGALAPGGEAILSGLLASQERAVRGAYHAQGLKLAARFPLGEWMTLVLSRPS